MLRPAVPQLAGHLVVEASTPVTSAGEVDAALWNALCEAVRRTGGVPASMIRGSRVKCAPDRMLTPSTSTSSWTAAATTSSGVRWRPV